jgi:Xaa-Pro aminopeptidase
MNRAFATIAKGEKNAKKIDTSARAFLARKYKDNFQHGLGHGVGTVIHEWPGFKPKTTDILPVGCVMTIEPGIYLPGFGGVRIEDMILITKNGYKNLTNVPKDLESVILEV